MAMPSFVANSTAVASNADICTLIATNTLDYPPTIAAGDILLVIFNANSTGGAEPSVFGMSDAGWSLIHDSGAGTGRYVGVYGKIAVGTEGSGTVDSTMSFASTPTTRFLSVMYQFTGSGTGGIDTSVGGATSGTSTTPSFASTTTNAANSLAIGITWANVSTTIGSNTGETGGDWTETAAEHTSPGNLIQVQTANMASIGTISGGTSTLGSSTTWYRYTFALEEALSKAIIFSPPTLMRHHIFR
jgi:hypothetical protein